MALSGITVLEFAGLAPGPFAGMALSDFGADVIRVDRVKNGKPAPHFDGMSRGKKSISLNLKSPQGVETLKKLVKTADVLIDPFRPGVMERNGVGPDVLLEANPRLIYARMTGFGQGGDPKVSLAAGHDMNYIALSGILSQLAHPGQAPQPPINLLGDFGGGGLICAFGIVLALFERVKSGKGQVIDAGMIDGANYLATQIVQMVQNGFLDNKNPGTRMLDGGAHYYQAYECKDGRYFSVGAIEKQFYKLLLEGMGFSSDEIPKMLKEQNDVSKWATNKELFAKIFKSKSQKEWTDIFFGTDACAWPILDYEQAFNLEHNKKRNLFQESLSIPGTMEPTAAPKLSRTPACAARRSPQSGEHTEKVLQEAGFSKEEVASLLSKQAVAKL